MKSIKTNFMSVIHAVRSSAGGRFVTQSEDINQLRKEMFDDVTFSDREQLLKDRKNVESDMRTAFNKLAYGQNIR